MIKQLQIYERPRGDRMKIIYILMLTLVILSNISCSTEAIDDAPDITYKQEMRLFVQGISQYAKGLNDEFIVIPQNGIELVTENGEATGIPADDYINSIDAVGREDLFYGYNSDNVATPLSESTYLLNFLEICLQKDVVVLTTDYCRDHSNMDDSYSQNAGYGFISFAAPERELNVVPDYPAAPYNVNADDVNSISEAKNFLYLINPANYATKQEFLSALQAINYDAIIMDYFFDAVTFSAAEIDQIKIKQNGGKRKIIAYMSIGEAEDYRYYWQSNWKPGSPDWIAGENPDWEGNYKVKYWDPQWQQIIFGDDNSYLKKIIDAHFDGVYLDIIDAFEYFE